MYLYPMDKASSSTLSKRGNFNLFSLSSSLSRSRTIQNLLVENLINKKTSIVLVPSTEQAQYFKSYLEQADLGSLSIIIGDNKTINDKDLATLRSAAKSKIEDARGKAYDSVATNLDNAQANLSESYELLNKKIFGERTWRTLSAQKEHFHFHNEVNLIKRKIDLEKINFTQKEYWNIRGRIEEASNTYVTKFSLLQKIDCLSPNLYKADHLDDKIIKLEKLINKGNNLLMSFGDLIANISDSLKEQGLEELQQLSAMTAAVSHSLTEYTKIEEDKTEKHGLQGMIKNVFSSDDGEAGIDVLRQQKKFLCDEFAESKYFDLGLLKNDHDSITALEIKEILSKADKVLSHWQKMIREYTDTKLKQMSPLNSEHQDLERLDKTLNEYLSEVNEAEILSERLEDNTFSLYKKLDLLEATLDKMRIGFAVLTENEDYIEWKSMLAYCKEGTAQIINALMNLPTKYWTRIFDQIFIGDLLDRNLSPKLPKNEVQLQHIDDLAHDYRSLMIEEVKAIWNHEKEAKLLELKKANKPLFNTLVKKNNPVDFTFSNIITSSPEFMTALYPIMIVTEKTISNIKPLYYKWSECISYNWSQLKGAGSIQLKGYSLKQTIIEENELSQHIKSKLSSYLNTDHMLSSTIDGDMLGSVTKTIVKMDNLEKLSKARSLSRILLAANPNLRLFYLRNASMISMLSDRENSRIVEQLSDTGIKEIGPAHELEETLIDMFVDHNKQCFILTEDGLLNTSDINTFDWQYHVIKKARVLGFKIVNMWTADMAESQNVLFTALKLKKEDKTALPVETSLNLS